MSDATMEEYNPSRSCSKCGSTRVETTYTNGKNSCSCHEKPTGLEHMIRTCQHCTHAWPERPLDAQAGS